MRPYDYTSEADVLTLFERQDGLCGCGCGRSISLQKPRNFIIEHLQALARGGSNDLSNKALWFVGCAKDKTFHPRSMASSISSDLFEVAKTKRLEKRRLGLERPKPKRRLPSRPMGKGKGFQPKGSRKMNWRKG